MLLLLPLLLGLRLLDIFRTTLRGPGDPEEDDDLPRLPGGARPLRGEIDLERERIGLRIGERVRLRGTGDLLSGLRARLGERRLGGGERLRTGPRILEGEGLLGGDEGEQPLNGDAGLLLGGGESPRR